MDTGSPRAPRGGSVLRVHAACVCVGWGRCDVSRLAFDGYEVALHGYISTKESAFSVKKRKRGGVDFYGGRVIPGSGKNNLHNSMGRVSPTRAGATLTLVKDLNKVNKYHPLAGGIVNLPQIVAEGSVSPTRAGGIGTQPIRNYLRNGITHTGGVDCSPLSKELDNGELPPHWRGGL